MNVVSIEWRLPGCGIDCMPRQHDPDAHETYGRILEREAAIGPTCGLGPLFINMADHRVLVDGAEVALTRTEWDLVVILARNVGRLVTHDDILAGVWGAGYEYRHIVRVNVSRLRQKLGSAGRLIATVAGHGFRLTDDPNAAVALPRPAPEPRRWARDWDACQWCHETGRDHFGRGLCARCYKRSRKAGRFL